VRSVHGVALSLDDASINILRPWLDPGTARSGSPVVEVRVAPRGAEPLPVLELLLEERDAWLGRTARGLLIGGIGRAWFSIEGAPAVVRSGGLAEELEPSDPSRSLLLAALIVALRTMGVYALHAGVVCNDNSALVLLGESGAGKSTTTAALVSAGYGYLGDDEVLLRDARGSAELIAYWPKFRLTERVLPTFAQLSAHLSPLGANPKWELDAASAFPGRGLSHWGGPITLLFLSRSAEEGSNLLPISLAESMGLLIAQSTALGLSCHPNPREHLDLLARFARRARRARLELGHEWLADPVGASRRLTEALGSRLTLTTGPEAS